MIRLLQRLLTREGSIAPILVAGKASIRLVRPGGVCLLVLFFLVGTSNWAQQPAEYGSNFDRRLTMTPAPVARQAAEVQALERLRDSLAGSLLETVDPNTGVTKGLWNPSGTLTAPADGEPLEVALAFVRSNMDSLGLQQGDLEFEVCNQVYSKISDTHHLYLCQTHQGLRVHNAQLQINVLGDGSILSVNNSFVPRTSQLVSDTEPAIKASDAVMAAARHLDIQLTTPPQATGDAVGVRQETPLAASEMSSEPIQAELQWLPVGSDVKLVWRCEIHTLDSQHVYEVTVDATTGLEPDDPNRVWTRFDRVSEAAYRVYPQPVESPNHTTPLPPADTRVLLTDPQNATASPQGWHSDGTTNFTIMRGNNVHAYNDIDANNTPPATEPNCGATLNCDFPINLTMQPNSYTDAAVANLFYWNNIVHDVQYQYGFDEQAGNFQVNNFGNGGIGGDDVRAEAQDGSGTNNANFFTPADGMRPRMQMFLGSNPNPDVDGDLDNLVIVHEYGHGISNRLVGGPGNVGCLRNRQQPGEGLSDWWGLAYTATAGDAGADARSVGTYLFGQPPNGPGIRPQRYSTDPAINNYTYESINGLAVPHGVGSVWAQAYWEVYWALVDAYGFDPNLYNATGGSGNQRAMLYINEGLKNTSCSPTFTDVRDGIIQATVILNGGQDTCLLWQTFAAFGLGTDAVSGGPNSTSPTNGFQVPASCGGRLKLDLDLNPNTRLGKGETSTLTAKVTLGGVPQAGRTVTFATANVARATVSPSSSVTNASGEATTTVTGEKSGWPRTTTVTATVDGTSVSKDQAVRVPDVSPVALVLLVACLVLFGLLRKKVGA